MNRILLLVTAAVVTLLGSCAEVVSLSSIVTPESIVWDDGLAGSWRRVPGQDEKNAADEPFKLVRVEGGYDFSSPDGKEDLGYNLRLTLLEINGERFAELNAVPGSDERVSSALGAGLAAHRIHRLVREGDQFTLRSLNFEHIRELAEQPSPGFKFLLMEDGSVVDRFSARGGDHQGMQQIILTDTPTKLRGWISRHADDEKFWMPPTTFERIVEKSAPETP